MVGNDCRTASIVALLQTPQLDELKTLRVSFAGLNAVGSFSVTFTTCPSSAPHCVISKMSAVDRTKFSVRRNPAASSRSCPGVRITTATLWPSTRISSGSSAAS
jgi:hypothetical protein